MNRQTPTLARLSQLLGLVSIVAGSLFGVLVATADAAATAPVYAPDGRAGANTYTTEGPLNPKCPNAIAGTPGTDPAEKILDSTGNTAASFQPGGTVYYSYTDNPRTATSSFKIEDCIVGYPADKFTVADFDANGVLINASKNDLIKDGTELDSATLEGVTDSTVAITFTWTSPSDLAPGTWVCNFARDVSAGHGGSGSRKVNPTCYQVPLQTVQKPTITPTVVCGANNDTVAIPDPDGATFKNGTTTVNGQTLTIPNSGLTIVATADPGYVLANPDANTNPPSWTFQWSDANTTCSSTTVQKPTITPTVVCGPDNDTVTIPDPDGATFMNGQTVVNGQTLTIPNAGLTIVATADQGYTLDAPDANTNPPSWTFQWSDANTACTVAKPTITPTVVCGPNNDSVTIPDPDGATFMNGQTVVNGQTLTIPNAGLTVVATADQGWALASPDANTNPPSWTFQWSDANTSCGGVGPTALTATPEAPDHDRNSACEVLDTYTIPDTPGVDYQIGGVTQQDGEYDLDEGDSVTIVAVAQPGYVLAPGATASWTFTGSNVQDCPPPVEPEEPEVPVEEPTGGGGSVIPPVAPVLPLTPDTNPPVAPAVTAKPVLAYTGADVTVTLWASIALIGIGLVLLLLSRGTGSLVQLSKRPIGSR